MRPIVCAVMLAAMLFDGRAQADVASAAPAGFKIVTEVLIDAPRATAWHSAVHEIGQWWSADHTISGDAARLSIDPEPQGCFCERLGDTAGVVHLTVTMVSPEIVLRMTGGLGPLGLMGVNGNMTWEFDELDGQTRVRLTYAVGGYYEGGLDRIAGAVDEVLSESLRRLEAYVETGDAEIAGHE